MPFTFTSAGGSGSGTPGADGAPGAGFGIFYLGNYNPSSGYVPDIAVVRGSDGQLYLAKASGALGDPVGNTAQWEVWIPKGADGANGQYPNYLGEYNNGASYPIGGIVSIPVGSPYGTPGQLFIRSTNPGNPGYPPGTASWTLYTNGLVVAGLPAFLPLTASNGAGNYLVPYGYFNYGAYGNTIAIARTPQVDAYMNYAISIGIPQMWTFKHFQSSEMNLSMFIQLGVPVPNVEIGGTGKEIWTLSYSASEWNQNQSGLAATYPTATFNGTEYGLFLAKTGALSLPA